MNKFYQMPKAIMENEKYNSLSMGGKLLYMLLYDRSKVSKENDWTDKEGRIYIYFTVEDAAVAIGAGQKLVVKLFRELASYELIKRKRQGLGKPALIYVKDLLGEGELSERQVKNAQKDISVTDLQDKSRVVEKTSQEVSERQSINNNTNKNNIINNKYINNKSIISDTTDDSDWSIYRQKICDNINYRSLSECNDKNELDSIVDIMLDVVMTKKKTIRINKDEIPASVVKMRFLRLDMYHIEYVLERLNSVGTNIKNIRAYIITTLFNAPETIDSYYRTQANYNFFHGGIDFIRKKLEERGKGMKDK